MAPQFHVVCGYRCLFWGVAGVGCVFSVGFYVCFRLCWTVTPWGPTLGLIVMLLLLFLKAFPVAYLTWQGFRNSVAFMQINKQTFPNCPASPGNGASSLKHLSFPGTRTPGATQHVSERANPLLPKHSPNPETQTDQGRVTGRMPPVGLASLCLFLACPGAPWRAEVMLWVTQGSGAGLGQGSLVSCRATGDAKGSSCGCWAISSVPER